MWCTIFERSNMINFELEQWRRKSSGDLSAATSPCTQLCLFLASGVERQGSQITLSVLARKTQVQQLLPTTGHWLPGSQAPSKSPASESRHLLRAIKCRESFAPPCFTCLNLLKTSARSSKHFRSWRPIMMRNWHCWGWQNGLCQYLALQWLMRNSRIISYFFKLWLLYMDDRQ